MERKTPQRQQASFFTHRAVLVTGGSGTIGAEIVRQVLAHDPRVVRIFSRDESKQAHLRLRLGDDPRLRFLIGDVRDERRLRLALEGVDVVFHAAALKHVPACEYNPFEAVQTNVIGTQNLIEACRETGVERLIAISTDKAVNPVNTMGATKLLAENVLRDAARWASGLRVGTVRFGNVLGSNGSLIPLLIQGMEQRREVELTSRRMTRFMMTIADAVRLVIESAIRCRGGEIYILKMPALRVADLVDVFVEDYCRFRGWPAGSVAIREVGPRPGDKLYEELVTQEETSRLREEDNAYVVEPRPLPEPSFSADEVPAACRSDKCSLLSRDEIRALTERAGLVASQDPLHARSPFLAEALA